MVDERILDKRILKDMQRFLVDYVGVSRETLEVFSEDDGSFKLSSLQRLLHIFTGYYSFTAYIDENLLIPFPEDFSFYAVKI